MGDAWGAVALVYDHHRLELPKRLTEVEHKHHEAAVSTLHVHLSYRLRLVSSNADNSLGGRKRLTMGLVGPVQEARARHPEKRVQIWSQDETRFGQKGTNSLTPACSRRLAGGARCLHYGPRI